MVESERWNLVDIHPLRVMASDHILVCLVEFQQCEICHGNHSCARIAVYFPECSELTDKDIVEPGQFGKHSPGSLVHTLIIIDKTADQRPFPFFGFEIAPDEEDFKPVVAYGEDNAVYAYMEAGEMRVV